MLGAKRSQHDRSGFIIKKKKTVSQQPNEVNTCVNPRGNGTSKQWLSTMNVNKLENDCEGSKKQENKSKE